MKPFQKQQPWVGEVVHSLVVLWLSVELEELVMLLIKGLSIRVVISKAILSPLQPQCLVV
jgi:hypothetical protein